MIFDRKLGFQALQNQLLAVNGEATGYTFGFDEKAVSAGYASGINGEHVLIRFVNIRIKHTGHTLALGIECTDSPSDVFALNLLKSADYEVILRIEEDFFAKVKAHLPHCVHLGHDRGMTTGIVEIYEKYKAGGNLRDLYLFLA
jgi:hypothetical protein